MFVCLESTWQKRYHHQPPQRVAFRSRTLGSRVSLNHLASLDIFIHLVILEKFGILIANVKYLLIKTPLTPSKVGKYMKNQNKKYYSKSDYN